MNLKTKPILAYKVCLEMTALTENKMNKFYTIYDGSAAPISCKVSLISQSKGVLE